MCSISTGVWHCSHLLEPCLSCILRRHQASAIDPLQADALMRNFFNVTTTWRSSLRRRLIAGSSASCRFVICAGIMCRSKPRAGLCVYENWHQQRILIWHAGGLLLLLHGVKSSPHYTTTANLQDGGPCCWPASLLQHLRRNRCARRRPPQSEGDFCLNGPRSLRHVLSKGCSSLCLDRPASLNTVTFVPGEDNADRTLPHCIR